MYISYLPDEMDISFEEALKIGAELGIRCVEMRSVDGTNCIDLNDDQVADAKKLLDQYGMKVASLATPFFKCTMPGLEHKASGPMHAAREMTYEENLALIPRAVEMAKAFGTDKVRLFTFWYKEGVDYWETLNASVQEALARVDGTGITLGVENEGACMLRTSKDLADAVTRLDSRVKFIYDPGNSARVGHTPQQEEFDVFSDRLTLVHVKDGRWDPVKQDSEASLIGEGAVNWAAELRRLKGNYSGPLTLEPHYAPGGDTVQGMRESVAALRRLAEDAGITLKE